MRQVGAEPPFSAPETDTLIDRLDLVGANVEEQDRKYDCKFLKEQDGKYDFKFPTLRKCVLNIFGVPR